MSTGLASAPPHNVGRIPWLTQQENFESVCSTAHRSGFSTPKLRKLHSKRSVKRSRGYAGGWEAEPSGKCGKCICYLGSWHRDCHHLRRPAFPRSDANRELHDSVIFGFILSRNNAQLLMLAAIKVFPVCAGTIDRSFVSSSSMRVSYSYSPSNSHHLSHQSTKNPSNTPAPAPDCSLLITRRSLPNQVESYFRSTVENGFRNLQLVLMISVVVSYRVQ